MFGFLTTARKRPAVRTQLGVTRLESRDTPSTMGPAQATAPVLSPLSAVAQSDGSVLVSGHVTDANPATVTVTVGGAASAQFRPNASGDFGVVIHPTGGSSVITVQAQDDQYLQANPVTYDTAQAIASGTPTANPPPADGTAPVQPATAETAEVKPASNVSVVVQVVQTPEGWRVSGDVEGDLPEGCHIEIDSGDPRLNGDRGDIRDDHSFQIDISLPHNTVVGIDVVVVDANGNVVGDAGHGMLGG